MTIKQKLDTVKKKINDNQDNILNALTVVGIGVIGAVGVYAGVKTVKSAANALESGPSFLMIDVDAMQDMPHGRTMFYETDEDLYYLDREAKQ